MKSQLFYLILVFLFLFLAGVLLVRQQPAYSRTLQQAVRPQPTNSGRLLTANTIPVL